MTAIPPIAIRAWQGRDKWLGAKPHNRKTAKPYNRKTS